jgi:pyruvate/2-oxoglutarate dehydrogenase complex dihydrolipoamide acyltransferase (E2) component
VLIAIYTYLTQIKYFKTPFNTLRRRMMIGTWGENTDPQIYAKIKLDIGKMEEYLLEKSNEIGEKITLTLFSIKLLSIVLKKYPEMYSYIKFGKVYIFKNINRL